jgi:hypothetical protein
LTDWSNTKLCSYFWPSGRAYMTHSMVSILRVVGMHAYIYMLYIVEALADDGRELDASIVSRSRRVSKHSRSFTLHPTYFIYTDVFESERYNNVIEGHTISWSTSAAAGSSPPFHQYALMCANSFRLYLNQS